MVRRLLWEQEIGGSTPSIQNMNKIYDRLRACGLSVEHSDELARKLVVASDFDQQVFLAWAEGGSYREVASMFNVSYGTVKNVIRSFSQRAQKSVIYNVEKKKKRSKRDRRNKCEKLAEMKNTATIFEFYENKENRIGLEKHIARAYGRHKMTLVDNAIDKDDFRQEMWCQLFECAPQNCAIAYLVTTVYNNAKNFTRGLRKQIVPQEVYRDC